MLSRFSHASAYVYIVARAKLITEQEQLVKRTTFLSVFQKDDRIAHNAHVQTTNKNKTKNKLLASQLDKHQV